MAGACRALSASLQCKLAGPLPISASMPHPSLQAGLLDQSPQREGGLRCIEALLRQDGGISAAGGDRWWQKGAQWAGGCALPAWIGTMQSVNMFMCLLAPPLPRLSREGARQGAPAGAAGPRGAVIRRAPAGVCVQPGGHVCRRGAALAPAALGGGTAQVAALKLGPTWPHGQLPSFLQGLLALADRL